MRIGVLSDLHWSVAPQAPARWHAPYDFDGMEARCAATVEALVARGCEVLVVAGDVTHDGDRASCDAALDCLLRVSPIPVAVVEGNHDVRLDRALVPQRGDVRDAWRRARAVAHEELVALHAAGVDRDERWALGCGAGSADHGLATVLVRARAVAHEELVALHAAGVDRDERWALGCGAGSADHGLATVLVSHYPLVPHADRMAAAGLPWPGELDDRGPLFERIAATRIPTVVLSGHLHVRDASCQDAVLQICVPALVERPHEAAVVEVEPLGHAVRCMRIRSDGPAPERGAEPWLLAPADERWTFADGSWSRREVGADRPYVLAEA